MIFFSLHIQTLSNENVLNFWKNKFLINQLIFENKMIISQNNINVFFKEFYQKDPDGFFSLVLSIKF